MPTITVDAMQAQVGSTFRSPWRTVDQATIDAFADATGDRQFIHVDPVAAAATPFGGTIAHGFLLVALLPVLAADADLPQIAGAAMTINYGCERLRFVSPVRAGSRIRGAFTLAALAERSPGRHRQSLAVAIEVEGAEAPALVADWIALIVL